MILTPALDHVRLARIVIAAGKDVYSEWSLSTTTAESEELLALAEAKGVRHVVGLQRRFGPSSRYLRDLVEQGYVGQMRSASMTVSVDAFGDTMPAIHSWSFDIANFANALSVCGGHLGDMLFHAVGFPKQLTAIVRNQFPVITVPETGEQFPTARPDAAMAIGTLANGAVFSVQIEGGQRHRTGLPIDITGTEGVLRVTNPRALQNKDDNAVTWVVERTGDDEYLVLVWVEQNGPPVTAPTKPGSSSCPVGFGQASGLRFRRGRTNPPSCLRPRGDASGAGRQARAGG